MQASSPTFKQLQLIISSHAYKVQFSTQTLS